MSRQGRWRGRGASSQGLLPPRPSCHTKRLTWHAETETSRCAGSFHHFSYLFCCSPSLQPLSDAAAVAVDAASISQDGNDMESLDSALLLCTLLMRLYMFAAMVSATCVVP